MQTSSLEKLETIIDHATDAIEFQLVIASLHSMLGRLCYSSNCELRSSLSSLSREFNSKMTISAARKKCKIAITAVSYALKYNYCGPI